MWIVWFLLGLILGISFVAIARTLGKRRIFATGLVVAAVIYVAFAAFGGASWAWIGLEVLGVGLYGALAVLGLRYSRWWLALGWAAHPAWDVALHIFGSGDAFSPAWYPVVCISFDLVVAAYIPFNRRRSGPNNSFKPNLLRGSA